MNKFAVLLVIMLVFGVLIVGIADVLDKSDCRSGQIPDNYIKGGCRDPCDYDKDNSCLECTHWDYTKEKCIKCSRGQSWNGTTCTTDVCSVHGVYDYINHKCDCVLTGTEYPPPVPAGKQIPGWEGELCNEDRNKCTTEKIELLTKPTYSKIVDQTKIPNFIKGSTWRCDPPYVKDTVCRKLTMNQPCLSDDGAEISGADCWPTLDSTNSNIVPCVAPCSGRGTLSNTAEYKDCKCSCGTKSNPACKWV